MSSHTIPPLPRSARREAVLRAVRVRQARRPQAVSLLLRQPVERPRRWV